MVAGAAKAGHCAKFATEEETSYAIGLIALCGTLSIFMLPLVGHVIGLDTREFGAWAGAAVHDVGQV